MFQDVPRISKVSTTHFPIYSNQDIYLKVEVSHMFQDIPKLFRDSEKTLSVAAQVPLRRRPASLSWLRWWPKSPWIAVALRRAESIEHQQTNGRKSIENQIGRALAENITPATQPLSHSEWLSGWVAASGTLDQSGWVAEWLVQSGWGSHSATQSLRVAD